MRAVTGLRVTELLLIALVTQSITAFAANTVVVESLEVRPCSQTVTVGIFIENDVTLSGLCLPLEIRRVSAGSAFIAESLQLTAANRLETTLMHTRQSVTLSEESEALTFWRCDGKGFDERMGADFSSPDAVLFVAVGTPYLAAGDDGETPSIVLEFGVNGLVGQFVIDTTCVTPNNHLLFVNDEFASFTPDFTMDTITIGDCGCPCFGDPQCDSVPTVLDIVHTLNVAFRGYSAVFDEGCAWKRTDTDHSGFTNVLDVVAVVNVAFRDLSNCSENWAKGCD